MEAVPRIPKVREMYGFKAKMVFCKLHPHKKCEHFCEDHITLLCNICLREKHRVCAILDESEMKPYFGKKIREAIQEIEAEKNEILKKTKGVVSSLDLSIIRLKKYRNRVDEILARLNEMKDEVDNQRSDVRRTTESLKDIERSLATASELKHCKQCLTDIDIERIKFERKQHKILKTPLRFTDELKISFGELSKNVKTMRNEIKSEFSDCKAELEFKSRNNEVNLKDLSQNPPYMDIRQKYAKLRAPRRRLALQTPVTSRGMSQLKSRSLQDDGRLAYTSFERHIRLPSITESKAHKSQPVIKFQSYRRNNSPDDSQWHMT